MKVIGQAERVWDQGDDLFIVMLGEEDGGVIDWEVRFYEGLPEGVTMAVWEQGLVARLMWPLWLTPFVLEAQDRYWQWKGNPQVPLGPFPAGSVEGVGSNREGGINADLLSAVRGALAAGNPLGSYLIPESGEMITVRHPQWQASQYAREVPLLAQRLSHAEYGFRDTQGQTFGGAEITEAIIYVVEGVRGVQHEREREAAEPAPDIQTDLLEQVVDYLGEGHALGGYYDVDRNLTMTYESAMWDDQRYRRVAERAESRLLQDEYDFRERLAGSFASAEITEAVIFILLPRRQAWESARRGRIWENQQAAERQVPSQGVRRGLTRR